jgi:hypothetical protein
MEMIEKFEERTHVQKDIYQIDIYLEHI